MASLMIYILDEKIPFAQLKDQLDKTQPLTKEEVVDLIISKIDGQDEINLKSFEKKYTKESFIDDTDNQQKYETYKEDFKNLENHYQYLGTWNDPNKLRSDLINTEFSYFIEHDKTILYNRQIEDWVDTAASWLALNRKVDYLRRAKKSALASISGNVENSIHNTNAPKKETSIIDNSTIEAITEVEQKKKVSEKWYALLHMIYINMKKEVPFEKKISKDELKKFGQEHYPFTGSGYSFYVAVRHIQNLGIYKYIFELPKNDYRKWKRIIKEISDNNNEVITWVDKNKI